MFEFYRILTVYWYVPACSQNPGNAMSLDFSHLPDLPQTPLLKQVANELFASDDVRAVWLGGSLARGSGDAFSDIDLRLFVTDDSFSETELPVAAVTLREHAVVRLPLRFDNVVLHHLMLDSGAIFDLLVQKASSEPSSEARLILGVKDDVLAEKLTVGADPPPPIFAPVTPQAIEKILSTFWISEQKHLKVIHRDLGLVAWQGEHFIRQEIVKLFFIAATGNDCGNAIGSIHVMSPVARAIQKAFGDEALALLGTPRRTLTELLAHAAELQDTVAALGRTLCERHGVTYPEAAEATVRRSWAAFQMPPSA